MPLDHAAEPATQPPSDQQLGALGGRNRVRRHDYRARAGRNSSALIGVATPIASAPSWTSNASALPSATQVDGVYKQGRRLWNGENAHEAAHNNASTAAEAAAEREESDPEDALPFLFTSIGVGTALVHISCSPRFSCLQQTVALFILGMVYSLLVDLSDLNTITHGFFGVSYHMWMNISPHLLLAVMLPILITGDSISIDTSVAKHVAKQCAYLAGPGVIICAFSLALFFWVYIPYDWPFMLCLTMSSILAATDPVAVVSLLKELGASPALTVQIQGESLLNDGTAMVLFTVAYDILRGQSFSFGDIVIFLVKSALCAVILGFFIGIIATAWIKHASNRLDERSSLIQISITLCCAYWSWIVAEGTFHVSGVLCTVSSALVLADRMWPSIASKEAMHHVWHTFEHIGNSTIFFVAGSLTGHNMVRIPFMDYIHLFVIYIVCTIVRGAMLFASVPVLNHLKHSCTEPVTIADATVMCWGGLRGALGLALAIKVNVDCAGGEIAPVDAERVLFYVGGVALLTLIVNATTCPALVKWLQLNRPNGTKQMMMINIQRQMADFASEHGVATGIIGSHLNSVLEEVQNSLMMSIDRSTVESIQKIAGPGGFTDRVMDHIGSGQSPTGPGSSPSFLDMAAGSEWSDNVQDIQPANDKVSRRAFSLWGNASRSVRRKHVPPSATLIKKFENAQKRLLKVPSEHLDRLGLSALPVARDTIEQLVELLIVDGDSASMQQMKPINDVFLSLVRAKYWASIEADEFVQNEGQVLLESISGALGMSGYKLSDLHYIRKHLLKHFGEEDSEVKCGVLMEELHGGEYGSQDGSERSDDGHKAEGCKYIVTSIWYNALVILVISVSSCISMAISILSDPAVYHAPTPGEKSTVHGLFSFFIIDFMMRLCAYKKDIFNTNWRKLDASLTVICFVGNMLEFLNVVGLIGESFLGSPLPEVIRALMVLQLLRAHQLFKSVRTIRSLRRMATGSAPKHLAGRLQVITILTSFTKAHYQSQEELIKYFGKCGKVGSGLVARCIVESLTEVCDATWMAWRVGFNINPAILNCLRSLRMCVTVTEDLCKLVEDAHQCGAMSEQDADSVMHPLKSQQYTLREMVSDTHRGIVPVNLTKAPPPSSPSVGRTVSEEGAVEKTSSKWGISLDEHSTGSRFKVVGDGLHSEPDTPRSVRDAAIQTESFSAGVPPEAERPFLDDNWAPAEQVDTATGAESLEAKERRLGGRLECAMTVQEAHHCGQKQALQTARSSHALLDHLKDGEASQDPGKKEVLDDTDASSCEGWSVYTIDDLVPPLHPPGMGVVADCQAARSEDVRL